MQILQSTIKAFNTLRPSQNGRHIPYDILKWVFLNEDVWISIEMSLKFVRKDQIYNILALVQIMAWRRPGIYYRLLHSVAHSGAVGKDPMVTDVFKYKRPYS